MQRSCPDTSLGRTPGGRFTEVEEVTSEFLQRYKIHISVHVCGAVSSQAGGGWETCPPCSPGAREPHAGRARVLTWAQHAPSLGHTGASAHLRGQAAAGQQSSGHMATLPHPSWHLSWQQQEGIRKGQEPSQHPPASGPPTEARGGRSIDRHQQDGRGHTTARSITREALRSTPADVGSPGAPAAPPTGPAPGTGGPKAQDQRKLAASQCHSLTPDKTRPTTRTSRAPACPSHPARPQVSCSPNSPHAN